MRMDSINLEMSLWTTLLNHCAMMPSNDISTLSGSVSFCVLVGQICHVCSNEAQRILLDAWKLASFWSRSSKRDYLLPVVSRWAVATGSHNPLHSTIWGQLEPMCFILSQET